MLGAYAHGRHSIDIPMIEKAGREVFGRPTAAEPDRKRLSSSAGIGLVVAAGLALAAVIGFALYGGWRQIAASTSLAAAGPASAPAAAASATRATPPAASAPATAAAPRATGASASSPGAMSPGAATVAATPGAIVATGATPSTRAAPADGAAPTSAADAARALPTGPLDAVALRARLQTFGVDEKTAWRELLPMWGIDGYSGDPCTAAARRQVRCARFGATLPMVKSLARPGLVWLRDDTGRSTTALLVGLNEKRATLRAGDETLAVQTAALARVWRGDFATAWRLPPGYASVVAEGASGPLVDRLATQMASFAGEPAPAPGQTMDAEMLAKVTKVPGGARPAADGKAGTDDLHAAEPRHRHRRAPARRRRAALTGAPPHVVHPRCPSPRRRRARARRGAEPAVAAAHDHRGRRRARRPRSLVWAVVALAIAVLALLAWNFLGGSRAAGACAHRRVDLDAGAGPLPALQPAPSAADRGPCRRAASGGGLRHRPDTDADAGAAADANGPPGRGSAADGQSRCRCAPRPAAPAAPKRVGAATTGTPGAAPATAEPRVHSQAELPEDIRRDLPKLVIGGSSYSGDAASRMVMINGQVFHEGDRLAPDLVLERIRLKSAVLAFKGWRYEVLF
jgi:hypothetical protein